MERQEQISVLIGTLEGDHSHDETRQKLLNLSAELCSVKAIESQQERKLSDLYHSFKKSELANSKIASQVEQLRSTNKDLIRELNKTESRAHELERKFQDAQACLNEQERELSDLKFQVEKEQYNGTIKEEKT